MKSLLILAVLGCVSAAPNFQNDPRFDFAARLGGIQALMQTLTMMSNLDTDAVNGLSNFNINALPIISDESKKDIRKLADITEKQLPELKEFSIVTRNLINEFRTALEKSGRDGLSTRNSYSNQATRTYQSPPKTVSRVTSSRSGAYSSGGSTRVASTPTVTKLRPTVSSVVFPPRFITRAPTAYVPGRKRSAQFTASASEGTKLFRTPNGYVSHVVMG